MKNTIRLICLLLVMCLLVLGLPISFAACTPKTNDPDPPGPNGGSESDPPTPAGSANLQLFDGDTAQFRVVVTATSGLPVFRAADRFVQRLRELGAQIANPHNDTEPSAVSDCEILIGGGALHRGAECAADTSSLSASSYYIRVVGDRVLIYGGSDEATIEALDYFTAACLYIQADSTSLEKRTIRRTYEKKYEKVQSVTLDGVPLSEYAFFVKKETVPINFLEYAGLVRDAFRTYIGVSLPILTQDDEEPAHPIRILFTEAGQTGFRVRLAGGELLMECAHENTFRRSVEGFITHTIAEFSGKVEITEGDVFTEDAHKIYYGEYGATGDGSTDDFAALLRTHEVANLTGQTVCADAGKIYYIGEQLQTIPVRTDVEWGDASFVIDDRSVRCTRCAPISGLSVDPSALHVFRVESDYATEWFRGADLEGLSLERGAKQIGTTFAGERLIYPRYSGHKIYIRQGGNQNEGTDTQEVLLVDREGNIDPSTAVLWNYPALTEMWAKRIDDKPVTISGGIFYTYANAHDRLYHYFARGIEILRSNTVIRDVRHYIRYEYETGAPYTGFISVNSCHHILIENCTFSGHKVYRLKTDSSNSMGTYDTQSARSNDVTWDGCQQSNSITDTTFWGVHASNFCKNLTLKNSILSRFDAHQGMYNATILNSTLGQYLNCIGAGLLYIDRLTRLAGNEFINLRADYGSTWEGDVIIKNSVLQGYRRTEGTSPELLSGPFSVFSARWVDWNFGYECFMPQNVTIENFIWPMGKQLIIFSLNMAPVQNSQNPYRVMQTLTWKSVGATTYSISNFPDVFSDLQIVHL